MCSARKLKTPACGITMSCLPLGADTAPESSSTPPAGWASHVLRAAQNSPLNYEALRPAPASAYSSLMPWQLPQVQKAFRVEGLLRKGARPPVSILDATAHVGVDTANFALMFPRAQITAVELDPEVAELLRANVANFAQVLKLPPGAAGPAVEVIEGCALETLAGGSWDLVYFDPPWGGRGYAAQDSVQLTLGGRPLGALVGETLNAGARCVVAKLPANGDLEQLCRDAQAVCPSVKNTVQDILRTSLRGGGSCVPYYRLAFFRRVSAAGLSPLAAFVEADTRDAPPPAHGPKKPSARVSPAPGRGAARPKNAAPRGWGAGRKGGGGGSGERAADAAW